MPVDMNLRTATACLTALTACTAPPATPAVGAGAKTHQELESFFKDWRAFQAPKTTDGVPDYTTSAMRAQRSEVPQWKARLAGFDTTGWSIAQQVDYHIVRAEINGLDFDHRVLQPWVNNPAFYVSVYGDESDQPAREGPSVSGTLELWAYKLPLGIKEQSDIAAALSHIPALLTQAKTNLTGNQKDLWARGVGEVKGQSRDLAQFVTALGTGAPAVTTAAQRAQQATDSFVVWLEAQAASKTGPSGIGRDNYNWYLKHVQLLPYTWQELVTLMQRELARSYSYLALEAVRNRGRPNQTIVSSDREHRERFNAAVSEYMAFLKESGVITVRDYMDSRLRARVGSYNPGPREFFTEVDYRDPEVMRTHGFHWFDKGAMSAGYGSPIRNAALLYNIFNARTEGLATGWEEMMMGAGMFDSRPRARELVWILLAERAARAMGDLGMHGDGWSIERAAQYASDNTPRGWLSMKGNLVWGEQHLYLEQPAYGVSYVIGKIEVERAIQQRMRLLGDKFAIGSFMDDLTSLGQIPIALIRWQLTGELTDDLRALLRETP